MAGRRSYDTATCRIPSLRRARWSSTWSPVNDADWKVRVGQYKQSKFPFVLDRDFSGLISAVGEGVMDLKLGDAVFGVCEAGQEGAYAEKIAVKAAAALMLSAGHAEGARSATAPDIAGA